MRRLSVSLLFLAGTFAFGQSAIQKNPADSPTASGRGVVVRPILSDNSGCPVGFFASRQAGSQMLNANDGKQSGFRQGLHFILEQFARPAIDNIEVTVYATSMKGVVLPAASVSNSSDTISKTFTLERKAGSNGLNEADVWMQQVGSVRWADLISVTFTDGTVWRSTENLKCRAVPSDFLLVGRR
jgi:hypothetical protein